MMDDKIDATPTSPIPPNAQGINSLDPMDPWRNENPKPVNPIIFNVFFNALTILIGTVVFFAAIIVLPYWAGNFFMTILNVEKNYRLDVWLFGLPMLMGSLAGVIAIAGLLMGLWNANKNAFFRMGYHRGAKPKKTDGD
jgi:hypothetical protein